MNNLIEQDPMKAILSVMAHLEEKNIEKKEKEQEHQSKQHEKGFSLSFETPQGVISLWSCWLGDQLYIGYPKDWNVSGALIQEILGMQEAAPVADKKWIRGDIYQDTTRKWAKFYSERFHEGGRVWFDHGDFYSYGRNFSLVQNEQLKQLYYGHDESMHIYNIGFSYFNEKTPDAPSAKEEHVQSYRDAFIQLALAIAKDHGGVMAVHAEYAFTVLTPALLESEGYTDIRYLKGNAEYRDSFGGTVLHAKKENEEIVLKSANSLVPWVNIRKIPVTSELTVDDILNKVLVF